MVFEKSVFNFGIYEWVFSTILYRDSIHNREYNFYYRDSKIFTIAQPYSGYYNNNVMGYDAYVLLV